MPRFTAGVPVVTSTPTVTVDPPLAVGRHVFRLVVVDDTGEQSDPAEAIVVIRPVITP